MKIKNYQDFYAGVMFVMFGVMAMYLSRGLQLGTAADMGPGYFPFYLGVLLSVLGAVVLLTALGRSAVESARVSLRPFILFIAIMLFSVVGVLFGTTPKAALSIGTVAGCVLALFMGLRTMGLVLGSVALFGLLIKGLGFVICVALLVIVAAVASHESKVKEVVLSIVFLSLLGVGLFVYALNLQMPIWPDTMELADMFTPATKR